MSESTLTLVLDVGKTRTKLLAIDDDGTLLRSWQRESRSVDADEGYRALDTVGVEAWLRETLSGMGAMRQQVRTIVPITHGAAFAGVAAEGLALPVPDYEFAGFDERTADWADQLDPFAQTLSPLLPRGLNGAVQLDWLERNLPGRVAAVQHWMPYAQYWAWWLSGVSSSEVSALGCHSLLWQPAAGQWSGLARRKGWSQRFAPLRRAWEVVGLLRPELAQALGLPRSVQVLCGAHDSNACLARYLRTWPRMTLVSSGTWVVVMAPGTAVAALAANGDFSANVSVRGDAVPTGRFMGGRDIERLCAGADPALADAQVMRDLVVRGVRAAHQSGGALDACERATLAVMDAAQQTARCVKALGAVGPLTVDGPLAANGVYLEMLAALLGEVHASIDPVEGTARGGYVLARWTDTGPTAPLVLHIEAPADAKRLQAYHAAERPENSPCPSLPASKT